VRNIVIGKSMSNILSFSGSKVIQACLVNDRGIHIAKSMLAYMRWGKGREPDKKPDHFVGDFYVLFNGKAKADEKLEEEAQKLLKKWESGDKEVIGLWKKMNAWAEEGFGETYRRLGIGFDRFYHESEIYDKGRKIVEKGLRDGKFKKLHGAITAELKQFGLPDKVLVRADGTTLYITQDIYLAIKKFEDYRLDQSVYVVGSEQNMHFAQLFAILQMLGNRIVRDCHHLSYGMVYLPEGRMKSREGTVVDADDIIADMIRLAGDEVRKRYEKLDKEEVERRSETIGLGALRFFMLRTDPAKDMTFDPKESISFEGETGPYVQYAYARISSILRKHGKAVVEKIDFSSFGEEEANLVRLLSQFPGTVADAEKYRPSAVCRYLLDLSQSFNEFYHKVPILKAPAKEKAARLLLISCVREVLGSGLALLDIGVLEEM
jgi:arginyl-tRNA synthetase